MISLLLVDPDPEFAKEIELVISKDEEARIVARGQNLDTVVPLLEEHHPMIILLGPNFETHQVAELLRKEVACFAETAFILFAPSHPKELDIPQGLLVETLSPPLRAQDLVGALERIIAERTARSFFSGGPPRAKIITVFSTKGGVGKTMIASNLAVHLAKTTGERIVVMDLDLQFGDVGVMLKLMPEHTIYDLLPVSHELSKELIEKFLTPHSSGASALLAPLQPELADLITVEHLKNVVDALRRYADVIVVDTPASFNDHVLTLLDETDLVLLVATMDIPSVKNVKLCLHTLQSLHYPDDKVSLVINRADETVGLKQREIETALGKVAAVTIPTDSRVPLSINRGTPVVLDSPKSAAAKALVNLATCVVKKTKTAKEAPVAV